VAKCHFTEQIHPQFQIKADNSKEYLAWMAAPIKIVGGLETLNRLHVYHKVWKILTPVHQLCIGSENHCIHIKCSSSDQQCAQKRMRQRSDLQMVQQITGADKQTIFELFTLMWMKTG
jgi:hypothetical protein